MFFSSPDPVDGVRIIKIINESEYEIVEHEVHEIDGKEISRVELEPESETEGENENV